MAQLERRFTLSPVSVKGGSAATKGKTVHGYAAVFGRRSQNLGTDAAPIFEIISPGAFDGVLKDDIRALVNHDPNLVLARSKGGAGTLKLGVDSTGLWYEFEADDEQSYARDLLVSLKRGDVDQSSFAFSVARGGDEWKDEKAGKLRTILRVGRLFDVSPVTYPAYPDATADVRHGNGAAITAPAPAAAWAARFGVGILRKSQATAAKTFIHKSSVQRIHS